MYIYKITNKKNGKKYVGQTEVSIEERFKRHLNDSVNLDTHLYRAMRKHGAENFTIDVIEEVTIEELDSREIYWIEKLNTFHDGYNSTLGGDGGNTYIKKTQEEMRTISKKISESKIGSNNPNHTPIKAKNVNSGEEIFFDTVRECREYFGEDHHNFITRRLKTEITYCYKGEWLIAHRNGPYPTNYTTHKGAGYSRSRKVTLEKNGEKNTFPTMTSAERYYGFPRGSLTKVRSRGSNKYREYTITF